MKDDVVALELGYVNGYGNLTYVHRIDGTISEDRRRIPSIFKEMARVELLDIEYSRMLIKRYHGIGRNIPYIFDKQNIFIPVKTRIPIGKNDGAMSFVKVSAIREIVDDKIRLETGKEIEVMEGKRVIKDRVIQGKIDAVILENIKFLS